MKYRLRVMTRAGQDLDEIFSWLYERSKTGASGWIEAFEAAAVSLLHDPEAHGLAPEDDEVEETLRQFFFKTRRGNTYRGLFVVAGEEVQILRVRGPGQPPLSSDELNDE